MTDTQQQGSFQIEVNGKLLPPNSLPMPPEGWYMNSVGELLLCTKDGVDAGGFDEESGEPAVLSYQDMFERMGLQGYLGAFHDIVNRSEYLGEP